MHKFLKDNRGAVTVFVTLLLIPAMLVSGTAVDLARIHTARGILQDANQLASNSILTQYDAMLQDIYGLFAVMEDDPIFGDLLNEYIQVAVFGEDWQDKELGTFQLFYGSDLNMDPVTPAPDKNLRNPDVLRRQIEEYAKFRAPVIIMNEVWDRIDKFKKLKADAEAIEKKMEVDDKIDEIHDIYGEIYEKIKIINKYEAIEESSFLIINFGLENINKQLKELEKTRDEWTSVFDNPEMTDYDEKIADLEKKFSDIKDNISSIVNGGKIVDGWVSGYFDENGEWVEGHWSRSSSSFSEIKKDIEVAEKDLNSYIVYMDELIEMCEKADRKKEELSKLIDELEEKLNSGDCTEDFVEGMTKPQKTSENNNEKPSIIDEYRSLFKYKTKPMAEAMKNRNEPYIKEVIGIIKDVAYGRVVNNELGYPLISLNNLTSLQGSEFAFDSIVIKRTMSNTNTKFLEELAELTINEIEYTQPNGFLIFQHKEFDTTNNGIFYEVLEGLFNTANNESAKKEKDKATKNIGRLLNSAQESFKKISLKPKGAQYYVAEGKSDSLGFGNEGDWGKDKEANNLTKDALNSDIISKIGDVFGEAGDKLLLLTYDTEMFSNFTTVSGTKTMSGVPMSTEVNYFFQSELEYLYNGDESSAVSNIRTVTGLVFLVRFVFNYMSTFIIADVNNELTTLSAVAGPYAGVVRELARLGYALAESAIDMKEILSSPSRGTPLLKIGVDQWTFSINGSLDNIADTLVDVATQEQGSKEDGMFYIDYVRIFLLFKDGNELANRTANLIEWNLTNKKYNIASDEKAMSNATLVDMSKLHTDFTITTTANFRMLFLSMPFAQKGVNGVVPPKTTPITVTDDRGY